MYSLHWQFKTNAAVAPLDGVSYFLMRSITGSDVENQKKRKKKTNHTSIVESASLSLNSTGKNIDLGYSRVSQKWIPGTLGSFRRV